jgi:sulfur carrier protein
MTLNGQHRANHSPVPLLLLLKQEGYDSDRVAVEKNGIVVPKKQFTDELVYDDDTLEIVCFVGGG